MATVAAIFDDSVALERAVSKLNDAGLGDDIVQVSENRDADTAPEQTETPAEPTGENVGSVGLPVAAGAGGNGGQAAEKAGRRRGALVLVVACAGHGRRKTPLQVSTLPLTPSETAVWNLLTRFVQFAHLDS